MPLRKPTADTTRAIDAFRAVLLHGPTSWPGAITAGDAMELLEIASVRWPEAIKATELERANAGRYRGALELIAADSALADDPMAIAETVLGGGTERDCRE